MIACTALLTVRRTGANLVCIGSFAFYWVAALLRRFAGIPVLFYIHGEELTTRVGSRLVGDRPFAALRKADGVVAVSSFTRDALLSLGVSPDRVALIPNGVDLHVFTPGEKDPALLDKYGLRGKRVLLTVGRLEPRKGHSTVIKALPRILQTCPDVVYLIVGSGREYVENTNLEALASELGLGERVIFAGQVPPEQLCAFYRTCDVFVMPNHTLPNGDTEGFGLVFLEAGACRKPVIGGRDGGVPDAVADGETGILVDGASAEQFAASAIRVLQNAELAGTLASQGLRRAQAMSWDAAAAKFHEFCRDILERRAAPPQ